MTTRFLFAPIAFALASAACAVQPTDTEAVARDEAALFYSGGFAWDLFGRTLNGRTLNGKELGQLGLASVSFDAATIVGRGVGRVALSGSRLRLGAGGESGGGVGDARALVGAVLGGVLVDGDTLPLRIDDVAASTAPGDDDVYRYAVSYRTDAGWQPLCGVDAHGEPVRAIALAGRWNFRAGVAGGGSHVDDESAFTFACEGYALAKCVEIGYAPWRTLSAHGDRGTNLRVSLAPMHQACTRALRADYCGDGTSFTVDGVALDLHDGLGYRTAEPGWTFEAEWDAGGARCAAAQRVATAPTPSCWSRLQLAGCGAAGDFQTGTLLMSQTAP